MIDVEQFRLAIVRPTLQYIGLWSADAEELLIGTAVQESRLTWFIQLDGDDDPWDGGLGVYQVEQATHADIYQNYLRYKPELLNKVRSLAGQHSFEADPRRELVWNLAYATAIARIKYRRDPNALPRATDIDAMARYWKRVYNSWRGDGRPEQFVENYRRFVSPVQ